MSKTYFETERLIIREADERDIEDLYELYTEHHLDEKRLPDRSGGGFPALLL